MVEATPTTMTSSEAPQETKGAASMPAQSCLSNSGKKLAHAMTSTFLVSKEDLMSEGPSTRKGAN